MSREIDALVAKKVMGWGDRTIEMDDYPKIAIRDIFGFDNPMEFSPSTDIGAAWKVVERASDFDLSRETNAYIKKRGEDFKYYAEIWIDGELGVAHGKTMPIAISLAALKAVGVEICTQK